VSGHRGGVDRTALPGARRSGPGAGRRGRLVRMRRGCAVVLVVLSLGVATLSGCTSARNTLGTNSSLCIRALAVARDAVHNQGQFAGVRLVKVSTLTPYPHLHQVVTARSSGPLRDVCLVSYRGRFRLDQVDRPTGRAPPGGIGRFAIVVVSLPRNALLATVVLEHEPVRFRHYEFGHFR